MLRFVVMYRRDYETRKGNSQVLSCCFSMQNLLPAELGLTYFINFIILKRKQLLE